MLFFSKTLKSTFNEHETSSQYEDRLLNGSIYHHSFKGIFHLFPKFLDHYLMRSKGRLLGRITKSSIACASKALIFPRNHRFYKCFDGKIKKLVEAGIIDHFEEHFKNLISSNRLLFQNLNEAEPLTLKHLEAGFVVWLLSLIFPFLAFIAEWILRSKDLIIFRFIFETYIKSFEKTVRDRDQYMLNQLRKIEIEKQKSVKSCDFKLLETKNVKKAKNIATCNRDVIKTVNNDLYEDKL